MKNHQGRNGGGPVSPVSNIRPEEVWDAEKVLQSPHILFLLSNIRNLNAGIVGIQKPARLADVLYRTARHYSEHQNNQYHILDRTVEDGEVQLLVHPYHEEIDRVIGIRMNAAEWSRMMKSTPSAAAAV